MKIVSIFASLDGEVTMGGPLQWAVFVRLGGCNLRCYKSTGMCDTPQALDAKYKYPELSVDQVLECVRGLGPTRLTITGGEPLLSQHRVEVFQLARRWMMSGGRVSVETNGSIELPREHIVRFDCVVMDLKTPSTEMHESMKLANLENLRSCDYVKAVVQDAYDLEWLTKHLKIRPTQAQIAVGPRMQSGEGAKYYLIPPEDIVEWMRERKLWNWRLNLQLQKIIWPKRTVQDADFVSYKAADFENLAGEEV